MTDFEAIVELLGLDQISMLGYSFGGPVAYTYAARHPERVQRVALVETGGAAALPSPGSNPNARMAGDAEAR